MPDDVEKLKAALAKLQLELDSVRGHRGHLARMLLWQTGEPGECPFPGPLPEVWKTWANPRKDRG